MNLSYFDNLAAVRGLAAVVVLLAHVVQLHFLRLVGLNTPLHLIFSIMSEYAVLVFFVLSGYLIAHSLEANIERNGKLRLDFYLAARIARLYPPFLYSIGVSIAVFFIMDTFGLPGRIGPLSFPDDLYAARDIVHLSVGEIIRAFFMLQGMTEINGPLWSLYIEAKVYAMFALALALITKGRGIVMKLWLAAVFFCIAWVGMKLNPGFASYSATWLIGALAYYVWNAKVGRQNRIFMCAVLIVSAWVWTLSDSTPIWPMVRDALIAVFIAWLLFKRRVRVPGHGRLSDCSYSLYATHFPVILLGQSLLISTGSVSPHAAIGVAVLSTATAIFISLLGGAIEAKKSVVQSILLAVLERFRALRLKTL